MKWPAAAFSVILLVIAVVLGSGDTSSVPVTVAVLSPESWDTFVPSGKEVDAIYGDVALVNGHLTAVIAQPKAGRNVNMTVKDNAGGLIDLAAHESSSDQLSAFYPGGRGVAYRSWSAKMDGDKKVDLASTTVSQGNSGSVTVVAEATEGRPRVEVTYALQADQPFLEMTSTWTNTGESPLDVSLGDEIRADSGKEDMPKSPNGESDWVWMHDRHWGQAYGVAAIDWTIQANQSSRNSTLKYLRDQTPGTVTLPPGKSVTVTRRLFVGKDRLSIEAQRAVLAGEQVTPVTIQAVDGGGHPIAEAYVNVTRDGHDVGSGKTDSDGRLTTRLVPGVYELGLEAFGSHVRRGQVAKSASGDETVHIKLQASGFHVGAVDADITDGEGTPIACKVEFIALDGKPDVSFGPETADHAVKNLYYSHNGRFRQSLPAGRYDVIVSHGPEYDAVFTQLTVPANGTAKLAHQLPRTVNTAGWVSSDFHSHSSPSGDNTGSQFGRVLNLVAEHIEFAPCTEHNRISTYEPHIAQLGIENAIATISGMELTGTPLPLNHQNAFPLVYRPRTQDGGGPTTDVDPEKQIERLALWDNRSPKLVQQNHPDIGWLFYDKNGDGEPDGGYERSFAHMDVMEIHPVYDALFLGPDSSRGGKWHNRVFNWLQLLNQGFRIYGVVNTDAHYNWHGSGGLRNWIRSSTDLPGEIDTGEMVAAAEAGRMVLSNGPFLEVTLKPSGGEQLVEVGQETHLTTGSGQLHVRVQCPNWCDIDRVFLLVNGRVHPDHDYRRESHPARFGNSSVKFDQTLDLNLSADSHLVVVAGGEHLQLGPVCGPSTGKDHPAAVSNPIFVDIDGNGFKANGDTLGHPLPVKEGTGK